MKRFQEGGFWDDKVIKNHLIMTAENTTYQPTCIALEEHIIHNAIIGLESGLEYAEMALLDHDKNLGRTTRKNTMWAEQMEIDILRLKSTINQIKNICEINL